MKQEDILDTVVDQEEQSDFKRQMIRQLCELKMSNQCLLQDLQRISDTLETLVIELTNDPDLTEAQREILRQVVGGITSGT